jgi:hypothetical protein
VRRFDWPALQNANRPDKPPQQTEPIRAAHSTGISKIPRSTKMFRRSDFRNARSVLIGSIKSELNYMNLLLKALCVMG